VTAQRQTRQLLRSGLAGVPRFIGLLTAWVAGLAFAVIFAVNLVQMVARALGGGWVWVPDVSQLLFLWLIMLGSVAAYCHGEHIVTGYLDGKLTGRSRRVLSVVLRVVEVVFFLVLVVSGSYVVQVRGNINYIQLGIPTSWAYLAIPVGGALMALAALTMPLISRPTEPVLAGDADLAAVEERST